MSASSAVSPEFDKREHRIARHHHAEIAVRRLGRMDEQGGGAGRGQGRRDLARDVAGLAHAGDHDPPGHRGQQRHRMRKPVVEAGRQRAQRGGLGLEDRGADGEILVTSKLVTRILGGQGGTGDACAHGQMSNPMRGTGL